MEKDQEKTKLRNKALEHYYRNIEYYRKYYKENKERILKYNKDYSKRAKKKPQNDQINKIIIQKGIFTLYFD